MPTSRSYYAYLIESLKDSQQASAYLNAVLEDGTSEEVQLALANVAEAQITVSDNAQLASHRKTIFETLSQQQLDLPNLLQILNELGFRISIAPREDAA